MLKNYFKTTIRNLWKQSAFSAINIAGLTLGIVVCLIIYLFIKDQVSYDNFHKNSENTYRLLRIGNINDENYLIGITSAPFAEAMINDFPQDIARTTRVLIASGLVSHDDKHFIENRLAFADSTFLETFSFPLEKGDKNSALDLPNGMLITKETATKYFGNKDPMGKIITVDNQLEFVVTGVFAQPPSKSHLDFDFVGSFEPLRKIGFMSDWWSNGLMTYVTLNENTDVQALESQLPAFMDKYFGDDFERMQNRIDLTLQPLEDIYFQQDVRYDDAMHGNKSFVYIFSAVGLFIFLIACINFMNLSTAKSLQRAKEVGVRKTLGSSKLQLTVQFFIESFLIATISVVLAFTLAEVTLPMLNEWFQIDLQPEHDLRILIPLVIGTILFTGLVSGLYPAVVLASFKPTRVLKGAAKSGKGGLTIRKALVVLQFSISVFLIIFTLVVQKQLNHINEKDLGFDKDQILLLELNYNTINENIEPFKNSLLANSAIKNVTLSSGSPGGFHDTGAVKIEGMEEQPRFRTLYIDQNYIPTYDLKIIAGRNFSVDHPSDKDGSVIINESAVRSLGWTNEEAISKRMYMSFSDSVYRNVIGVVKDYNFSSLKSKVRPLIIQMTNNASLMSIKLDSKAKANQTLGFIEDEWSKYVPFKPNYHFLNDQLDNLYQNENLQSSLFQLFSGISIFIACLGIFGLASFTAVQRRKEIGIRKVLGASVRGISNLLAKDYLKLVFLANLIAWPSGIYFANKWLDEFAYRTNVSLSILIVSLFLALAIALLSVFFQSVRAALANPADTLKEE